jgi:ubiquinone/menaquinone biosynthesis C-methylase UbiE
MHTANFNIIDKILMEWRFQRVKQYITAGNRVLDIGCGTQAKLLHHFSPLIEEGIGIDYDLEAQIDQDNIHLIPHHFVENLPFPSDSFNKVVMLAVLEHIPLNEVHGDIREIYRVLKKNGLLIMTTPTPPSRYVLEMLAHLGIISKGEVFDHKKYYNRKDIVELCRNSGFKMFSYNTFQLGLNSQIVLIKQ